MARPPALIDNLRFQHGPALAARRRRVSWRPCPLAAGLDAVDLAAWTVVGNVLLNLDEMFTKR